MASLTPTRVLLLCDAFPPRHGGSGRWLWELYRRLEDVAVAVVATDAPGAAEFDRTAPFPIERWRRPFRSWGLLSPAGAMGYPAFVRQANAAAARHRPEVVHCGKCLPEGLVGLAVGRRAGVPVWVYVHGEELTLTRTSRELRWWTEFVLRHAAQIIANSEHTRSLLVGDWHVPVAKVRVLTPGVDTDRFVPVPHDADTRRRLGWDERRVILTVGTLQERKGQDMLIRALPRIRGHCPDVLYALAGDGPYRERLQQMAQELGVNDLVQFLGAVNDDTLVSCYQQCDLFALPNRQVDWDFEGFGIVLLEAQACGRPVVAGASGGTAETIIRGETGERVPCEVPDHLAETCAGLLNDPARRARLGAKGREWVTSRFDWRVLARDASLLFRPPPRAGS